MERAERTIASACGIMKLDGMTVPKTVRDSIRRCLDGDGIFDFAVVYVAGARANYRSMHKLDLSPEDPYCYDGTKALVNKLNIRDPNVLRDKIRDVVPIRIAELEVHPITLGMSSEYLKTIHRRLFGDVFSWAGEYRTEDCSEPTFCRSVHIGTCIDSLFEELEKEEFLSRSNDLEERLSHYMTELFAIRPFRFGNGISVRVLTNSLAIMNGKFLDFSKASVSLFDIAMKHAIAGNKAMLQEILSTIISDY